MSKTDKIHSDITGKEYSPHQAVRIINPQQAIAYIYNGQELLDMYPSVDFKTGKPLLVYIFDRNGSQDVYDAWCKGELKKPTKETINENIN